jgi:hypothetical protein
LETKFLYDTSIAGPIADKRINVASVGLSGDESDGWNGDGLSTFGATVGFGHLSEFASKNLDGSESFSFGGPGVRAYPVGEAPAGAGVLATRELRYNMAAPANLGVLQWQVFVDHGDVTLHKDPWSTYLTSTCRRASGCRWSSTGRHDSRSAYFLNLAAILSMAAFTSPPARSM